MKHTYKCRLEQARTQLKHCNPYIRLASCPDKENYFYALFKGKLVGRIYERSSRWYLWYEKTNYRQRLTSDKPFTEAIKILELESASCVA